MAIEVTEEMRQAVYESDCEEKGHLLNVSKMVGDSKNNSDMSSFRQDVIGPNDGMLPHISCDRCDYVWLVMPVPGKNYDDAINKLKSLLSNPDSIRPKRRRDSHSHS